MTREEVVKELKEYEDGVDMEYATPFDKAILYTINALEQEPILDKIREQMISNLKGVNIAIEVLDENHPLRQKMEGAKDTLIDCLELIDNVERRWQLDPDDTLH